jgi:hypothetical protein
MASVVDQHMNCSEVRRGKFHDLRGRIDQRQIDFQPGGLSTLLAQIGRKRFGKTTLDARP